MQTMRLPGYPLIGLLTLLVGCGLYGRPDPAPQPDVAVPATFSESAGGDVPGDWVNAFQDAQLTELVREGLQHSHDLAALAARVRVARAQAGIAAAPLWPEVSLGLDGARSRSNTSLAGSNQAILSESYAADANISWEADLWQRLSNQARAGRHDARASAADHVAARLALAANISRTWFQAISARQQSSTLRQTLQNYRANLETVSDGVIAGINPVLDLRLLRAQAAAAESQLAASNGTLSNLTLSLQALLGRAPGGPLEIAARMPELPDTPATGLPLQLLERRPDLLAARERLLSQEERTLAANKNLLPALRLGGSGGRSASRFADLADPDFLVWTISASLLQPVFSGGRLLAERDAARAERDARIADYAAATVQAISEVERALQAEQWLNAQVHAQQTATLESVAAEELAREQYAAGLVDIATLLEAQRRALEAQRNLISLRGQRLQNRVDLHLALGGSALIDPMIEIQTP